MRRAVLAAVAAAAVIVAVLVLRDHGWLGGRAQGGPLHAASAGIGVTVRPGQTMEWNETDISVPHGGPVTIESVRVGPARMLRGLRLGAPRVYGHGPWWAVGRPAPRSVGRAAEGAQIGTRSLVLAVPVTPLQTGPYELTDLRIRYRRGSRHFETGAGATLRLTVRR
jgi:hypothetical protein